MPLDTVGRVAYACQATGNASVQTGRRTGISDGVVARLNANGRLDTTFGTGGLTLITANPFPTGLGLDAAGDVFALPGQSQLSPQPGVTEISPAGQLDATVTPEPLTVTSVGATFDRNNEQFVYPQTFSLSETLLDVEIQRYTTAGTLASSTGPFTFAGTSGSVRDTPSAVTVLPNGQALLIGTHANGPTIADSQAAVQAFALANPNGTLDSSFGTGGTALTNVNLTSGGFSALFPQSDGTVIAVGVGTISSTQSGLVIARFNSLTARTRYQVKRTGRPRAARGRPWRRISCARPPRGGWSTRLRVSSDAAVLWITP